MNLSKDLFCERERALENEFFRKVDEELIRKLQAQVQADGDRAALARETGIATGTVLDSLVALGFSPKTLLAFSLVPLVRVAWADRIVDQRERAAVLHAAKAAGLHEDAPGFQLLASWLTESPGDKLFATWKRYAAALSSVLPADQVHALSTELSRRAREVATVTGGILGYGSVSRAEESALQEIEDAFKPA